MSSALVLACVVREHARRLPRPGRPGLRPTTDGDR